MKFRSKLAIYMVFGTLFLGSTNSFSQDGPPPPPPPGGGHGSGENQIPGPEGGNASLGGGITLLLGLIALYGVKKLADVNLDSIDMTD